MASETTRQQQQQQTQGDGDMGEARALTTLNLLFCRHCASGCRRGRRRRRCAG